MKVRFRYAIIPLMALLGILLALFLQWRSSSATPPVEPAPAAAPVPAPTNP